jgi:hypothetical protein
MQSTNRLFILPTNPHIRTNAETWAELERLRSLSDLVPSETKFGDSNRLAIEAAIDTLIKRSTVERVADEYEDDGDYVLSAALDAVEWLRDNGPAPSDGWTLVQAA